jgi:anti-sigma factor RsiW
LDYVNQRPVAVLVYEHRKHVINVYVWPNAVGGETTTRIQSHQGYQMLHWGEQGMTYWAVSDLNQDELAQFREVMHRPPA